MNMYTCIDRVKSGNKITGYVLMDTTAHTTLNITSEDLKMLLKQSRVVISNLKLTRDGRIILNRRDFDDTSDKQEDKHKELVTNTGLEKYADELISEALVHLCDNDVIKLQMHERKGDINAFSIRINNKYTNTTDNIDLVFRYRKDIKRNAGGYRTNLIIRLIGLERNNTPIPMKYIKDLKMYWGSIDDGIVNGNITSIELSEELLDYITKVLIVNCCGKDTKKLNKLNGLINYKHTELKKAGVRVTLSLVAIAACCGLLTGCGVITEAATPVEVSTQATSREYKCDFKTIALKTKIAVNIDGKDVMIKGNLFKFVTDPLKMVDEDDNVLAYADDSYNFFSEDDHAILVDDVVECIMQGNFDIIGKSYKILDGKGNHIADFERNMITSMGARIIDIDGNLIAEYDRLPLMNDFTVTVYDNEELSDKAIMMIMSSFVSDQKYQDKSTSVSVSTDKHK